VVPAEPAVLLSSLDAGIDLVRQQAGQFVPERKNRRTSVVAARGSQLARHLDRLEAASLFRRACGRRGKARWSGYGIGGASFALSRANRQMLLGADPPVRLTSRAEAALAKARTAAIDTVHPGGSVIVRSDDDVRWWT
jgi:ATP-dependent Lhr-like helicase